uniref:MIR domain-containing protein n=1 Tax=Globodera rostochiensis TaxID=31243 RepID=A0A914I9U2_GLORO
MIPILFGLLRAPNRAGTERAGAQSCRAQSCAPSRARPIVRAQSWCSAKHQKIGTSPVVFAYTEEDPVTCGSVLKLQSVADSSRLHSHEVKYGSGSGQQSVTGNSNSDDVNSHWQIIGSNAQACQRGQPVKCDSVVRLMHLQTRCFLHSHEFPAPLSRGMQEVSCFGKEGQQSDAGDHYQVICSGDVWTQDEQIKLKHENTGNYLSVSGQQFGRPISGQREVIAAPSAGYKSLWLATEGVFIKP